MQGNCTTARQVYYEKINNELSDPVKVSTKSWWGCLKRCLGHKIDSNIGALEIEGAILSNRTDIATAFNNYF